MCRWPLITLVQCIRTGIYDRTLICLSLFSDAGSCWDGIDPHYFNGVVAETRNGYTCQHWTNHMPHPHDYDVDENFPADGSVLAAGNNCRDPDSNGYIWCYTMDEYVRWDYCDFPPCSGRSFNKLVLTYCILETPKRVLCAKQYINQIKVHQDTYNSYTKYITFGIQK